MCRKALGAWRLGRDRRARRRNLRGHSPSASKAFRPTRLDPSPFCSGAEATPLCQATLTGGGASCVATVPGAGTVVASYSGDTSYAAVSLAGISVAPNKATSTLSLEAPAGDVTAAVGDDISFAASLSTAASDAIAPTGTVTFFIGNRPACTDTILGGEASCDASVLAGDSGTLSAAYAGNSTTSRSTDTGGTLVLSVPAQTTQAVTTSSTPTTTTGTTTGSATTTDAAPATGACHEHDDIDLRDHDHSDNHGGKARSRPRDQDPRASRHACSRSAVDRFGRRPRARLDCRGHGALGSDLARPGYGRPRRLVLTAIHAPDRPGSRLASSDRHRDRCEWRAAHANRVVRDRPAGAVRSSDGATASCSGCHYADHVDNDSADDDNRRGSRHHPLPRPRRCRSSSRAGMLGRLSARSPEASHCCRCWAPLARREPRVLPAAEVGVGGGSERQRAEDAAKPVALPFLMLTSIKKKNEKLRWEVRRRATAPGRGGCRDGRRSTGSAWRCLSAWLRLRLWARVCSETRTTCAR